MGALYVRFGSIVLCNAGLYAWFAYCACWHCILWRSGVRFHSATSGAVMVNVLIRFRFDGTLSGFCWIGRFAHAREARKFGKKNRSRGVVRYRKTRN